MKKLASILAVILSLVLLVAPISAGAETLDMVAIQISDPMVTVNGESMLDLSGLTLQLAGGANPDASLIQLFLDVIGGGNPVNSALVQFDENGIAAIIGGMTSAYGIPMEVITALMEEMTASMDMEAMVAESAVAAQQMANWELPQQIAELVTGYFETNKVPAQNYTRDVSLTTGNVSAEFEAYTVDCNALMPQIVALLDADATALELLAFLNSQGAVYAESYAELLPTDQINWSLFMAEATGDNFTCQDTVLKMDNGDVINFGFNALSEALADGSRTGLAMSIYPEAEEFTGQNVYLSLDVTSSVITTIAGHFGYNFGDDETYDLALMATASGGTFNAMLSDTMGMVNASCSYTPGNLGITATIDGETMNAYCNWSEAGFSVGFNAGDEGSLDLTYASEANAAYFLKGRLSLTVFDGYDTIAASLGVGVVPGTVDSSATYIAPEIVTDLTSMDEEQAYAAQNELMTVLQNTIITLADYVPGLQMLMEGM